MQQPRPKQKPQPKGYYLILAILAITLSACKNISPTPVTTAGIALNISSASPTPPPIFTATLLPPSPTTLPVFTTAARNNSMPVLLPATAVYLPPAAAPIPNYTAGLAQGSNAPFEVDYSLCDSSAYLEDVNIPDGTIFAPGEVFVKTWLLRNTGFCTWKDDYALTLFQGNSMSGQDTKIEKKIAAGRDTKVSITLTAPNEAGTYTGYWILKNEYGTAFGMPFFVQIVVQEQ